MTDSSVTRLLGALTTAVLLLCGAAGGNALTVQEAKDEAARANLDIKVYQERTTQALFLTDESYTKLLPVVSILGTTSYLNEETASTVKQGSYGLFPFGQIPATDVKIVTVENNVSGVGTIAVKQPLFQGGRLYNSYKAKKSQAHEARWGERQMVQDTLLSVETAYYALLKAIDLHHIAEQHQRTLLSHLKDMESLYSKGRVPLNDLLKVKVEVAAAEGDVIRVRNEVSLAEGTINLLLNRPLSQPVDPFPLGDPVPVVLKREQAEEIAKSNNKALNSARARRLTSRLQRMVTEADYYPNIALTTQYSVQEGQPTNPSTQWAVFVTMEWSIWEWGGTKAKVNAARSYERQQEYAIAALESKIAGKVRESYYLIEESDKQLLVAAEEIEQAQENFRITEIAFTHGRKTSTDLMDAEVLLLKARSNSAQHKYNGYTARAQLRYEMGRIEEENFSVLGASLNSPVAQGSLTK